MKFVDYSENNSLISSILFLVIGVLLFTNPGGVVEYISYILGGFLIVIGIMSLLTYYRTQKNLNTASQSNLISGIILIVLGLISILGASIIETIIRLIVGSWVLYSGVMRLIGSINYKKDKTSFIIRLIIALILIICGFYIILKSNLVFSMIGLLLIFYSVLEIVGYIFYTKK